MDDTFGEEVGIPPTSPDISDTVMTILDQMEWSDSFVGVDSMVVEDALSNFVVLKTIFLMLEEDDLLIIRQVSKCWRTVVDLMISTRYDVQLGKRNFEQDGDNPGPLEIDYVVVKKRDRENRRSFTEFETNFEGAFQILKEDVQSPKITISINVEKNVDIRDGLGRHFFSQFGHLVVDLEFTGRYSLPLNSFCKLLLQDLPNLKELKLSDLWLEDDSLEDQMFSPDVHQHIHSKLRKISFSYGTSGTWTVGTLGKFLKMFPNLETIDQMPLLFTEAVVQAQKGHVLKSLSNFDDDCEFGDNEDTEATACNKLAQLQPKLTSFHLRPSTYPIGTNEFGLMISSVFSILQSSSVSLEALYMSPTTFYGFLAIPKMTGLKSLELNDADEFAFEGDIEFFPPGVSLQETFPNVSDFSISLMFGYIKLNENWVNRYLPAHLFTPWGSQIKQLKLPTVPPKILPLLQRIFPNIENLLLGDSGNEVTEILLDLPHIWPQLKSLTIPVSVRPHGLEWIFLSLPEDILGQLRDPTGSGHFTDTDIQGFKDQCCISKLKGLKQLRMVLRYCVENVDPDIGEATPISNQLGFRLLQGLEVSVQIWRYHKYLEAFKEDLKPLITSGNIEIVESTRYESW